jgi:2-polyprenyl-3-methyl-5-hydroxy-6-metoxy-1,4-benzoquinol methylase
MKDERAWIFEHYLSSFYGMEQNPDVARSYEILLEKYLPDDKDAAILEIGPGRGELVGMLVRKGYRRVEAVDISHEVAATVSARGVTAHQADDLAVFLGRQAGRYDLVTMFYVLEHIEIRDTLAVMTALRGCLRPGGVLLFLVNNAANPFDPQYRYIDISHTTSYTEYSLAQLLAAAGWTRYALLPFERSPFPAVRIARMLFRAVFYPFLRALARAEGIPPHRVLTPLILAVARKD